MTVSLAAFLSLEQERDRLKASNARLRVVCDEILEIMTVYHKQEKSSYGVDTPGGLEHMGDVWGLFLKWEDALSA